MFFAIRFCFLVLLGTLAPPLSTCQATRDMTILAEKNSNRNTRPNRNSRPYLDLPLDQIAKQIPELKGIRPTTDQERLTTILSQTAVKVDELFNSVIDVLAQEDVIRARLSPSGSTSSHIRYDYLIVHHTKGNVRIIEEYRTDSRGNRVEQVGLDQGFSLTSGFVLMCVHFASGHQSDSRFRYLGQQLIGPRNTYVVGFSELPEHPSAAVSGAWGNALFLIEGIAWVDEYSSEIIRMRTDLLAPLVQIGLDEQTTEVSFGEVRLSDESQPLWLPSGVTVEAELQGTKFRNEHRYTNYRRYWVSSKIVVPN